MAKQPSYKRLQVDERRRQLLDAGAALFAEQAYEEISMRDIAKAACRSIWAYCKEPEPTAERQRWLEVNRAKFLFHDNQHWTHIDGEQFAALAFERPRDFIGLELEIAGSELTNPGPT